MDRHFAGFRIKDKQTMGCVATCFLVLLIVLRNSCGQKLVILKKTAFQFGSKTKYPPPPHGTTMVGRKEILKGRSLLSHAYAKSFKTKPDVILRIEKVIAVYFLTSETF